MMKNRSHDDKTKTKTFSLPKVLPMALPPLLLAASVTSANDCSKYLDKNSRHDDLFLEEVEGAKALNWVNRQNERTISRLKKDPKFAQMKRTALDLLNSNDRIPYAGFVEQNLYGFWQDEKNPRGLLQRTTLKRYESADPQWETVLDVDKLAQSEGKNWVYKGSVSCRQDPSKTLIKLSDGGKDAVVIREFDVEKKEFVQGGFSLEEAKSGVVWLDPDTLIVGTHFSPDSLTESGYPRLLKIWRRGTPLGKAQTIFEGQKDDIAVQASLLSSSSSSDKDQVIIYRIKKFFDDTEYFLLNEENVPEPIPIPKDAVIEAHLKGNLVISLRSQWRYQGEVFAQGAIVHITLKEFQGGKGGAELILAPTKEMAIQRVATTKEDLFIQILENVRGKVLQMKKDPGGWVAHRLPLPELGTPSIHSTQREGHHLLVNYQDFLTPSTLYLYGARTRELSSLYSLPARFDPSKYEAKQFHATSADGTRIPYFMVSSKNLKLNGTNPTLLYGYGGFENSQTPFYSSFIEKFWLKEGGVYVLANIRGGGEFGPAWHKAALKENRQKAFDDFIAIAEDLIKRGVTKPKHLGIEGGSNGGLLVGAVVTQRPELFNAALIQVPLLDMMRYHKLLAGVSWMEEYGNPEDPIMGPIIKAYSPYHNVRENVSYPEVFFMTSTKDDRVHPGHARRMAKKMQDQSHPFLYYENTEGGHGGSANFEQSSFWYALKYVYLLQKLKSL
ncbi:MAG: prolyl oligopeptidase family serine peptidase [Bacteriovoracales bacterium]|nr:prolyl oligopeptidase family serine peptidase [Bacteriovoracales bacterium]